MSLSTHFRAELEEEIEILENQKDAIRSEVTLLDTQLDRYDVIIENIDRDLVPLINEINVGINSVKNAYDNRVSIGCKNDLSWEVVKQTKVRFGITEYNSVTYEVKKNSDVSETTNYYGVKFYRKPQNKDYGSNVIGEFTGTISLGSTSLAVISIGGTSGILVGDTIVDNIDDPVIFSSGNLPTVVGFDTTSEIGINTTISGSISVGSTILAFTGTGSTIGINTGDAIGLEYILPENTTVVGFSTGSEFSSILLSTSPTASVTGQLFTAIRNTEIGSSVFNEETNPIDPVSIDLMDLNKAGLGHKVVLVNNGSPIGPFQWHEVREDREPDCGASFALYYPGNESWPSISTFTYNPSTGALISVATTYASIGARVTIGVGTLSSNGIGTITSKPARFNGTVPSAGVCASYSSSITSYESSLTTIINRNVPKITELISKSSILRRLRDKKESAAFSLSQAYDFVVSEIQQATSDLNNLRVEDFSKYDPDNYKPTRRSTAVGIASAI